MLPGVRFLLGAIVLSMSILVFGLGAAALLRAAHEEFASNPSWRPLPEATFAQPSEPAKPVLAMLRVEPPAEPKSSETTPAAPATEPAPIVSAPVESPPLASTPAEPAASASTPAEAPAIAALKGEEVPPQETAKPEIPIVETSPQRETPPPKADAPASADAPAPADETKIAAAEQVLPPVNEAVPAAPERITAPVAADPDNTSAKIASLGTAGTIETSLQAKAASHKPDTSAIKKRLQARRAAQRRRVALRARAARQAQAPQQPAADPFSQPTITTPTR